MTSHLRKEQFIIFVQSFLYRLRKLLAVTILFGFIFPAQVLAGPIHDHCMTAGWLETGFTPHSLPITFGTRPGEGDLLRTTWGFNTSASPPPGSEECKYEISDITRIFVTLNFDGHDSFQFDQIDFNLGDNIGPTNDFVMFGVTFESGVPRSFSIPPHQSPDAIELSIPFSPGAIFGFQFFPSDVENRVTITEATLRIGGTHYYVPEPATLLLLILGLAGIASTTRKAFL